MSSRRPICSLGLAAAIFASAAPSLAQTESPSVPDTNAALPAPPVAEQRPHSFTTHGITVEDPYFWMKDQGYPEIDDEDVLAYLNAENAYFQAVMAPHEALIETLTAEMRGRIAENDASVPVPDGDYEYWYAYNEGQEYRLWYRRPRGAGPGGDDELLLDENALAEGHEQFSLGTIQISPDARILAYSTDTDGSERYVLRFKDLTTGDDLPDTVPGIRSDVVWAADSGSIVYTPVDENWRSKVVMLHGLGTRASADTEIFREAEEGMEVGIDQTQSRRFLTIFAGDNVSNEVRLIPLADLSAANILVSPRQTNRQYDVEEHAGTLYIHSNDGHVNFRIATASLDNPGEWDELIAGSDDFYITGLTNFANFYVIEGRERGLDQVEIRYYDNESVERIAFPEASYDAGLGPVAEFDTDTLRIDYQSMVTPDTDFSYNVTYDPADGEPRGELTTLKVREIPSGYDASQYTTERLEIEARDGTMVPVSLVHRRDTDISADTPMHLYAYGAYGYAVPPIFSTRQLSLVDRGFIFAIAHIRGGDDLGYQWYLDGKLERRTNTMLDESLPLTPGEWPEWGNPITDADAFRLIQSYSPYDNVSAQDYPPIMITAGLNDPRVTYWEPAKWTARLRATRTDDDLTVLRTNMGAGHQGQSGRFQALRDEAESMAFMLTQLGVEE